MWYLREQDYTLLYFYFFALCFQGPVVCICQYPLLACCPVVCACAFCHGATGEDDVELPEPMAIYFGTVFCTLWAGGVFTGVGLMIASFYLHDQMTNNWETSQVCIPEPARQNRTSKTWEPALL